MRFEWDEAKRARNVETHGIDLLEAVPMIREQAMVTHPSPRGGEMRVRATGVIDGRYFTVVWTERDGAIRLISLRRARHGERREHQERYG